MAYRGRVSKVSEDRKYGFIDIRTVTMEDGSPHDLATSHDLFIHSDVFGGLVSLEIGMEFMIYNVFPDDKRGDGFFKVVGARETEQSRLERLSKGGIEINAQGLTGGRRLEHSSIFMSWCLSQTLARKVKEQMVNRKAVRLLVIQRRERSGSKHDDVYSERRQLAELSAPMACLSFDAPGKHRVFALVVWAESEGDLKDVYLSRTNDKFKTDVISSNGTEVILEEKTRGFWASSPEIHWFGTGCIEVELPEELFAKHPRDWEWVNTFFKTPPRDQCRFRARRFIAYPLKPILVTVVFGALGLWWVFRLLAVAGLLLAGFRGVNFETLRHFKWHSLSSAWENLGNSVFVPRIKGRRVFVPIAVSPLFLLGAGLFEVGWLGFNYTALLHFFVGGVLTSAVVFVIITLVMAWMDTVDWQAARDRRQEAERRALGAEADRLVCMGSGPREPNVWQLPLGPKTIRFYALAVKQYVCRKFR